MRLIEQIDQIFHSLAEHFGQNRIFDLFKSHVVANLELSGRHTVSNAICLIGREQEDWSRDYRLFSTHQWDVKGCMNTVLKIGLEHLPPLSFVPIAVDLTHKRKHGRKIPKASYQLDPLSPPFQRGILWGIRFLHASLLIPMHHHNLPARGIPIRFEIAPSIKKPGKRGTPQDWVEYRKAIKLMNANLQTVAMFTDLRRVLDEYGIKKNILLTGDGGFCNRTCFQNLPAGIDLLVRCRKDAKLCFQSTEKSRFYSQTKFTPEEARKDEQIPLQKASIFYGGDWREIEYKEVADTLWQRGAAKRKLRMLVIKPVPYRKTSSGNDNYRDPAYLLTTDLTSPAHELIQTYFNRNEIEVNHRDMKNNLGLGEAQVHSERGVERHPQAVMLGYSILILASLRAFGPLRNEAYVPPPKWYKGRLRPTIEDMKRVLRKELSTSPEWAQHFGLKTSWGDGNQKTAA